MDQIEIVSLALDRIEEALPGPITVRAVADRSPLSPWHFQRVFRAVVGDSVGGYVRRRRLACSVHALLESDARILDIAIDHGFESQEAYTRAFKRLFGLPPGRFRERGRRPGRSALDRPTTATLRIDRKLRSTDPEIRVRDPETFIGLETRFISALADETNNHQVIPSIWAAFRARRAEISGATDDADYGLSMLPDAEGEAESLELAYLAGQRVEPAAPAPDGMKREETVGGSFAVFAHSGPPELIAHTIVYALLEWLPGSDYTFRHDIEIERIEPDTMRSEFWLPVSEGVTR